MGTTDPGHDARVGELKRAREARDDTAFMLREIMRKQDVIDELIRGIERRLIDVKFGAVAKPRGLTDGELFPDRGKEEVQ